MTMIFDTDERQASFFEYPIYFFIAELPRVFSMGSIIELDSQQRAETCSITDDEIHRLFIDMTERTPPILSRNLVVEDGRQMHLSEYLISLSDDGFQPGKEFLFSRSHERIFPLISVFSLSLWQVLLSEQFQESKRPEKNRHVNDEFGHTPILHLGGEAEGGLLFEAL